MSLNRFWPFLVIVSMVLTAPAAFAQVKQPHILAFGDSLMSGYLLQPEQSFPAVLQNRLIQEGWPVTVQNAGRPGETTAGGVPRLKQVLDASARKPDLVLLGLGANDIFRGVPAVTSRQNLQAMLTLLQQRKIPTLLIGMSLPVNLQGTYFNGHNRMYAELAKEFEVPLYPFFLKGVALNPNLNLPDRIHPNAAGIVVMVDSILASVTGILEDRYPDSYQEPGKFPHAEGGWL